MTELSAHPAIETPSTAPPASYWTLAIRKMLRPWLVKIFAAYIAAVLLISLTVPLLASGKPYAIDIHTGNGWVTRYPLFADLTTRDYLTFIAGAVIIGIVVAWRLTRVVEMMRRRSLRLGIAGVLIGAGILGGSALAILHHNRFDGTDYRALIKSGMAKNAIFAPIPWGYAEMEPLSKNAINELPSWHHWLGTDRSGRDVLARMLWASRVAMGIGFVSQAIALSLGIIVGAMMGYFGGIFDLLGMRLVEMVEAIPTFFLILTFIAIFGRSILMIMVILGVTGWTGYARFLRAEFLRIRQLDYIVAARATGMPLWRIMFRHMLPNGLTPVLVSASFGLAGAVTIESSLSYLGIGVRPPTPSWGGMLNAAGNPATVFHWFEALPPGLALFLIVLAFNIVGEALRDAIDPKSLS
jgi:peptide/nickel transport system permease protein